MSNGNKKICIYSFCLLIASPHLNPIEILWRKIKYEWLTYEAIESQQALDEELSNILRKVGSQYTIKFKEQSKKVSSIFT